MDEAALGEVEAEGTGAARPDELPATQVRELPTLVPRFFGHLNKSPSYTTQDIILVAEL